MESTNLYNNNKTNPDDLVSKLRDVRVHNEVRKAKRKSILRYQKCLQDAVHDIYRNALIPIFNPYFLAHDEDLQNELWDIRKLVCGGDVQQAKMYIKNQVEPFCTDESKCIFL